VVVVRHGALVYKQYFSGEDMYGYVVPYNANTLHDIASITKGVIAAQAISSVFLTLDLEHVHVSGRY
jgi:CubicO group peptidase (beta-lactamase class C family)